ncbi:twin-arginine translocation pathway signal [Loktanella sp. 3ANDIMAR09]|uniref:DUF1501 domain-containing protein n=1 Tax=Loktanella sp. 3ANDIMAR09 TaxID=1225657 RepID=UPI0006F2D531|nr:DUF1501 domain-containing protein [Loktanella sp. 3ANDIMAR09]KQI68104.1 twin-arginine translocation pathway signal [Loktanella sp. 3ANDIMAR09]
MDRRAFLTRSLALGCSLAASPLVTPVALAQGPWDARLVVIVLRGGLDGLDVIRPIGDTDLARLRPRLMETAGLGLNDAWALHPGLSGLRALWDAGQFGALHATSSPYRGPRSHFDAQDVLEAGTFPAGETRSGWLNRMLGIVPGMTAETAYSVGHEQMKILSGTNPYLQWSPRSELDLSPQSRRLLDLILHDDPIFRDAALRAVDIADTLFTEATADAEEAGADGEMGMMMAPAPTRGHAGVAAFAAQRLRAETRIASFSLHGWDTHSRQDIQLNSALENLTETILTLRDGLGPVWEQTAVLCMTEFGRTAHENGTLGTDHGTGGAMLFAGGALRGGQVLGRWPGLAEADLFDRRDLMPTSDVRAAAGRVMQDLFGLSRSDIEDTIFPGLDMADAPRLAV